MKIWAVGSSFGSTKDMTSEFISDRVWYDGYAESDDERYKEILLKIAVGDYLVMKSSSTKGKGHKTSFTKVKAIGRVRSKSSYYQFDVDWIKVYNPAIEFDDISYRKTIELIRLDIINIFVLEVISMKEKESLISLLEYRKQIILQGPPGTGKTRLAKYLATTIIKETIEIDDADIRELISVGLHFPSSTKYTNYLIVGISEIWVEVRLQDSSSKYRISFSDIKKAFVKRLWKGGQQNGSDPYAAAIAMFIFENLNRHSKQSKLIQFHPSYTYEDFVRGIVVETEGESPTYTSVDKVFSELAKKAQQNYLDSLKTPEEVSREKQLDGFMNEFKDDIEERIEASNGKYILDGTTTYLFDADESCLRYTGDNWASTLGHRLYLKDIMILFLAKAKTRKDINANPNVSGSARQHSSYYLRVLQLFEKFMENKTINKESQVKTELKSYVLIIDEINRANLPSVLGELIYGLEYRGEPIESMYEVDGNREMIIPPNLYVIGTMNTADRSVGHIDYAIRRRFAFVDVLPTIDPIKNELAKSMFEKVSKLFVANYTEIISDKAVPKRAETLMADFRPEDVWIGHSYFLTNKKGGQEAIDEIKIKMKYEVLPLLKEYVKDGILRSNEENSEDTVQMVLKELNGL